MRKNRRRNFISTMLLCDVFICIICPIPFFELHYNESNFVQGYDSSDSKAHATYLLSDFILTFMFLRLYLVIRNVFNHTQFSDPYAKLHCERHGFTANTRFCFKCYLQKYPATTIFTTLFISVFALSYVNRISERPMFKVVSNFPYVSVLNNVSATLVVDVGLRHASLQFKSQLAIRSVEATWNGCLNPVLLILVGPIEADLSWPGQACHLPTDSTPGSTGLATLILV